jgi:putative heme iron utilization protein
LIERVGWYCLVLTGYRKTQMNIEALKLIANQEPVVTTSTATTAVKGRSYCKFCTNGGLFSIYRGREWEHANNCPWVAAKDELKELAEQ